MALRARLSAVSWLSPPIPYPTLLIPAPPHLWQLCDGIAGEVECRQLAQPRQLGRELGQAQARQVEAGQCCVMHLGGGKRGGVLPERGGVEGAQAGQVEAGQSRVVYLGGEGGGGGERVTA